MSTLITDQDRERAAIPEPFKWNVADLYADDRAWRSAMATIRVEFSRLDAYRGRLGASPQTLADAMDDLWRLDKEVSRLATYASLRADEDTRIAGAQGMQQEVQQLIADFRS